MHRNTRYPDSYKSIVFLICGLMFNPAAQAASSYLEQLEAEATADSSPAPKPPAGRSNWSQQQTSLSEKLDTGLDIGQFEESLKQRFYGSYLFYSTLNDTKQQVVFQEYRKNSDIEHVREAIKAQMTQ
ncbi:MAG TPA: hypothetical protein VGB35_02370 [Gammaproteobacteria bacterium]|jgi:hypothetical protein